MCERSIFGHLMGKAGKVLFGALILPLLLLFGVPKTYSAVPNLVINEFMASNAEYLRDPDYNNYVDWVEIYNAGSSTVNLNGYYLTDDLSEPDKFEIRRNFTLDPGEFFLFWLDDEDHRNHTNFRLKHQGEEVGLFMPDLTLVDGLSYADQVADVSYGRSPDGGSTWLFFQQPTPGEPNNTPGLANIEQAGEALFSAEGGFYTDPFNLTITPPSANATVTYTLDGTPPTINSPTANGPILISETSIVRARAFEAGKLDGPVVTHTYFMDDGSNLPIFSLVTDPDHLFDDMNGIYVRGNNGVDIGCPAGTANYFQAWERPISLEFFEPDGSLGFKFNSGVEIFGFCGRSLNIKGLDIKLDRRYGANKLEYELFPDFYLTEFKTFLLRPSSQDQVETMFRDGFVQTLLDGRMDIDKQAYRPAVLFINGEYWGIHNIREKLNDDYIDYHHGETDIDLINNRWQVREGDLEAYTQLEKFIKNNDLTVPENYEYVAARIDIDEYINYLIAEMYSANGDWPDNNIRFWRPRQENEQWRWMLFDLDKAWRDPNKRMMNVATKDYPGKEWATIVFPKMIENPTFRDEWLQRMAGHMNTTYETDRVLGILESIRGTVEPEIGRHGQRWGQPTMDTWLTKVEEMRTFARERKAEMTLHLIQYFNLDGTVNLTVNTSDGGSVAVSGLEVPGPDYSGPYFEGIPIRLQALPQAGYQFVEWTELGNSDQETFIMLSGDFTVTAVYEPTGPPPDIVINELHYNPSDDQGADDDYEFLELLNNGPEAVDLSGFTFADGIDFTFPAATSIASGEMILVAKNATTYNSLSCQVFQWEDSSLSNGGEMVQLEDGPGTIIDFVDYDDEGDWTSIPDGNGPSLELIGPDLDNSLAASWQASSPLGGTPCAENSAGSAADLVINEIHYNPADVQGDDEDYEFLELINNSDDPLVLDGYTVVSGIAYTFPVSTTLPAGEMLLLAKNGDTYNGLGCPVYQWDSGSLSNGGELLQVDDSLAMTADVVEYDDEDGWPWQPDGDGSSLELIDPASNNSLAASWQASSGVGGTPCAENSDGNPPPDQIISLDAGWQMISGYVAPVDSTMENVLADIASNMELIKNGDGQVYWPAMSITNISEWEVTDGYQIFMKGADTLSLYGPPADPDETPISLQRGWNLVPYFSDTTQPIGQVLNSISGSLLLAKNGAGELYWPAYGINQIGEMQPGKGYQLYMTDDATLSYGGN